MTATAPNGRVPDPTPEDLREWGYDPEDAKKADGLCDPAIERRILGTMIADGEAARTSAGLFRPEDFAVSEHRKLFQVMSRVAFLGETPSHVDPVLISDELRRMGEEKFAGDWLRLGADLLDEGIPGVNLEPYADRLRDLATRRSLTAEIERLGKSVRDPSLSVVDLVAGTVEKLVGTAQPNVKEPSIAHDLGEVLGEIETRAHLGADRCEGYSTGIKALDELTDGLVAGRQITLAARKKQGKTALALNFAARVAYRGGGVHFASGEMSRRRLLRRLAGLRSKVNLRDLRTPEKYEEHFTSLVSAAKEITGWPLRIDDQSLTPKQIRLSVLRSKAALERQGIPLKLVIADYLTKFRPDEKAERRDLAVGEICGSLTRLTGELGVCVLVIAQLNRDSERDGKTRRPTAQDLRDSGIIEQDCDQLLLLWDGPKGTPDMKNWPHYRSQIIVELNRDGPTGEVDTTFQREIGRFTGYVGL